jgi:hypothetical protein
MLYKHGEAANYSGVVTSEYRAWTSMRARCLKPDHPDYGDYGGRGITICERWDIYENFLADMERKPSSKHSLGRRDNDGNYSKENCRWELQVDQIRNRRSTKTVVVCGRAIPIATALEKIGMAATRNNIERVVWRLANGWSDDDAVGQPAQAKTSPRRRS